MNKATCEQLIKRLGNSQDITICSDVVYGLYFEYHLKEKEIDRLNNIINELESYCNIAIAMNFNMNNSKLQDQIVEDYANILNKLKQLKDSD